ncbi:MAG: Uma2 family endonuclease [Chloroflexi bacterium]|nr:Uma2 family endonuclease [Chloroflexota bacterium]
MSTPLRFTVSDLELLPEDGKRYEIIDGELHVSTQPHWQHQYVSTRIVISFDRWDPDSERGVLIPAPGLIFAPDQAVAPDVVWISRARFDQVVGPDGKLHAAPDLVVEILSPGAANEQRDRELKLELYSRYGVREYWLVDWRRQTLDVYRREQDALALAVRLSAEDSLTSPLLPGFAVLVRALCATP